MKRDHTPFVYTTSTRHNYLSHYPTSPPTVYPHMASASDTVPDAVNHVDHRQDMRLDIEDMAYEEFLALSDHIGTVKTGLSEEDVTHILLKRRTSCRPESTWKKLHQPIWKQILAT
ncbi:putative E3 ubiquitin-protein ligase HIP1 [Raphanus sativus]|nr:putative E3 ubiquitin-protein ligase HIP1 [Raphanus sativus]